MDQHLSAIVEQLTAAGVAEPHAVAEDLGRYLSIVLEVNTRLNLTRVTEWPEAVRLHLYDSLVALPELAGAPQGTLLDIGTGGGFPGVPLARATRRHAVLMDSVKKKCRAVSEILDSLGWGTDIECVGERAETYALDAPGQFAAVVARAVAPLPSLVELAAPLLCEPGGRFIALKGQLEDAELLQADAVAKLVGLRRVSLRRLSLPVESERRTIAVYERIGGSKVPLPRRIGLAQNAPLA